MQEKWVLGLAVVLCVWLAESVSRVQAADADPFAAAGLERFPRAFPIPEVGLPDPEGQHVALRSFKGQALLMNFWTTW